MAGTTVRDDGERCGQSALGALAVGIDEQSERGTEARVVVRGTMGWSKADVFARLLGPDQAAAATAVFATAYEVAAWRGRMTGACDVLRSLREHGVAVCLTTGFAPTTGTRCWPRSGGRVRSTWRCHRPTARGRPAPDMILGAMARLGVADPAAVAVVATP